MVRVCLLISKDSILWEVSNINGAITGITIPTPNKSINTVMKMVSKGDFCLVACVILFFCGDKLKHFFGSSKKNTLSKDSSQIQVTNATLMLKNSSSHFAKNFLHLNTLHSNYSSN